MLPYLEYILELQLMYHFLVLSFVIEYILIFLAYYILQNQVVDMSLYL
eukprot:UN05395